MQPFRCRSDLTRVGELAAQQVARMKDEPLKRDLLNRQPPPARGKHKAGRQNRETRSIRDPRGPCRCETCWVAHSFPMFFEAVPHAWKMAIRERGPTGQK